MAIRQRFVIQAPTAASRKTADQLRKNGGFIPGIRPGAPTRDYLAKVVFRISLAGAIFLGTVAVSPIIVGWFFLVRGIVREHREIEAGNRPGLTGEEEPGAPAPAPDGSRHDERPGGPYLPGRRGRSEAQGSERGSERVKTGDLQPAASRPAE